MNKIYTIATLFIAFVVLVFGQNSSSSSDGYPCPFYRQLSLENPPINGNDVFVLQGLLSRSGPSVPLSANFDEFTQAALMKYQSSNGLDVTGVLDIDTATLILETNIEDGYKDNGQIPPGFKYKVHIPVYKNRSIETTATLYDANMKSLLNFTVKTHGQDNADGTAMNEFCDDGSTPTGLMTFDLNSPEPDPVDFGPYPINRAVQGIAGNAFLLISNVRDGILMHTGEWKGWNPSLPMPYSHGCVHCFPEDIYQVWQILTNDLGVQVRNNTFGQLPYLYQPQGVLSIELIDE